MYTNWWYWMIHRIMMTMTLNRPRNTGAMVVRTNSVVVIFLAWRTSSFRCVARRSCIWIHANWDWIMDLKIVLNWPRNMRAALFRTNDVVVMLLSRRLRNNHSMFISWRSNSVHGTVLSRRTHNIRDWL
jgi:hypothetical protein